jgi:hypothetical protein
MAMTGATIGRARSAATAAAAAAAATTTAGLLALAAVAAAAAATAGCGKPCTLDGSEGQALSLEFDRCQAALQMGRYLIVEYVLDDGVSEAAQLTVDTMLCPIEPNAELDFAGCAFLGRTVPDGTDFPAVEMGTVVLFQWGGVGDTIDGEFHVLFTNGNTLSGEFRAELVDRS